MEEKKLVAQSYHPLDKVTCQRLDKLTIPLVTLWSTAKWISLSEKRPKWFHVPPYHAQFVDNVVTKAGPPKDPLLNNLVENLDAYLQSNPECIEFFKDCGYKGPVFLPAATVREIAYTCSGLTSTLLALEYIENHDPPTWFKIPLQLREHMAEAKTRFSDERLMHKDFSVYDRWQAKLPLLRFYLEDFLYVLSRPNCEGPSEPLGTFKACGYVSYF
jgi:hypothetical protein